MISPGVWLRTMTSADGGRVIAASQCKSVQISKISKILKAIACVSRAANDAAMQH